MVAIIKTGHSIRNIFNYNEIKVKEGVAQCIGEGNYPVDVDKMNLTMKLNRLLKQAALNDNVTRNSVHISLNFDPSETGLSQEKLMDIAADYMERIGFGQQPYLVYQHHDAGHPHIHLVSIKIKDDGSRIDTQNIGRNQSETARKEIEKEYGLVVAQGRRKGEGFELQPISTAKVRYGKIQSKKAIANVLGVVLPNYKYASLPELNAVLQLYNVKADRGSEGSRIFKGGGLVYRILDGDGIPTGVPIKASDFYNRSTLKFLEQKFPANKVAQVLHKARVKSVIDRALLGNNLVLSGFIGALEKEGVNTVLRKNSDGIVYGITYVDHTTKSVFNGSALGKAYSAKVILERCGTTAKDDQKVGAVKNDISRRIIGRDRAKAINNKQGMPATNGFNRAGSDSAIEKLADLLTQAEQAPGYIPGELKGRRKKKKRKGRSDNP